MRGRTELPGQGGVGRGGDIGGQGTGIHGIEETHGEHGREDAQYGSVDGGERDGSSGEHVG